MHTRALIIGLVGLGLAGCEMNDGGGGDRLPPLRDFVDGNHDDYDDFDAQFLLDILANNPQLQIHFSELGEQEWVDGRLVELALRPPLDASAIEDLSGPLPGSIGYLDALEELHIWHQDFHGPLPPTLGQLPRLNLLWCIAAGALGTIPEEIGSLPRLQWLAFGSCGLTGTIPPSLSALPLISLRLDHNELTGVVPSLDVATLQVLNLNSNQLEGEVFQSFASGHKLQNIDVARNEFTGEIPGSLFDPETILSFRVAGNRFGGVIPPEICKIPFISGGTTGNTSLEDNEFCPPAPACAEEIVGEQGCEGW